MKMVYCFICLYYGLEWIVRRGLADETTSTQYAGPKNFTYAEATKLCDEHLRQSHLIKSCGRFLKYDDVTLIVESCATDVQLTGVTVWTLVYLELLKEQCLSTAVETVPLDEPLPDSIVNNLCLASCQNNGICYLGACICEPEFSGLQCEISMLTKPVVYQRHMLCDRQTSACEGLIIRGENFFQSDNITCILHQEKKESSNQIAVQGRYISDRQVYCPTPLLGKSKIQVSNGFQGSSDYFFFYAYNSSCQQCVDDPEMGVSCNVSSGYCTIYGDCVDDQVTDNDDRCNFCSSKNNRWSWTRKSDLSCHKQQLWIICGVSSAVIFLLSVIITIGVCINRYRKSGSNNLAKPNEVEMGVFSITQPSQIQPLALSENIIN